MIKENINKKLKEPFIGNSDPIASPNGKKPRLIPRRKRVMPSITNMAPRIKLGISDFEMKIKKKKTTTDTGPTDRITLSSSFLISSGIVSLTRPTLFHLYNFLLFLIFISFYEKINHNPIYFDYSINKKELLILIWIIER